MSSIDDDSAIARARARVFDSIFGASTGRSDSNTIVSQLLPAPAVSKLVTVKATTSATATAKVPA